ncbi:DUF7448 domain-containing protein [Jiangella asiatica]|uniref:DUF7448 domain-containing protein n=1 Tax=Jiangella asiatica TaxID=2530372 RepID=A0A4R5CZP2_9ACTN|nr:hypothetical protein [Jiangella asiatica]TDE03435.1 hypothetical protein E1269_20570 [Jiangella asiatica]
MTFKPIEGTASSWRTEPGVIRLNEENQDEITQLLLWRKVTKVDGEHLLLNDGTVIKAIGHEGGCACSAGDYDLSVLNGVDNVITRVAFDYCPTGDDEGWGDESTAAQRCEYEAREDRYEGHYRIFVFAENQRINLMQFDGSDGNGYYGTGFELLVRPAETKGD